jgi:hypothetical protein
MLLELGKAISLFASILVLYPVLVSAFFVPGAHWEDRLLETLLKLGIAACVCFGSGLLFAWHAAPTDSQSQHGQLRLRSTLPVQLFWWALLVIGVVFAVGWYVTCGNPLRMYINPTCG